MVIFESLSSLLGLRLEPEDLSFFQVVLRSGIVFLAALLMVRLAHKRFLARLSAFDVILGFVLASMLARAVNGSAPFFSTLGAGFVLVGLHRLLSYVALHSSRLGRLLKGDADVLVRNGQTNLPALRKHSLSQEDLLEELRLNGKVSELSQVETATLERNGQVSVVPRRPGRGQG